MKTKGNVVIQRLYNILSTKRYESVCKPVREDLHNMYTICHKHLDPLVTFNILDYKAHVANKITDLQSNSWKMNMEDSII